LFLVNFSVFAQENLSPHNLFYHCKSTTKSDFLNEGDFGAALLNENSDEVIAQIGNDNKNPTSYKSGSVIFSFVGDIPILDPGVVKDRSGIQICSSIFEGLVKYDKSSFQIVPAIAHKWVNQDNRIWTFYLKQNVKFHDGTICDSSSIKFNFDRQLEPSHPFSKPSYGFFSSMRSLFGVYGEEILKTEAPLPDKFRVILKDPDALFLNKLAHISASIVSPSAVKKYNNLFGENPVGTGAYRFAEWRKPGRIILTANSSQNLFYLNRIIYDTYLDIDSCARQLARGNIDIAADLQIKHAKSSGAARNITFTTSKTFDQCFLLFNCKNRDLRSREIRKAISHLINRKELALLFDGELSPSFIYAPLSDFSGDKGIDFSIEKAEALLKTNSNYSNRTLNLIYSSEVSFIQDPQAFADKIKFYLTQGGIKINLRQLSAEDYHREMSNGNYDMAVYVNSDISGDSNINLRFLWSSRAIKYGKNFSFYSNNLIDELLKKTENMSSASERLLIYRKIDSVLLSDMPAVPLFYCYQSVAYNKNVSNIKFHPSGIINMSEVRLQF